MSKWYSKGKGRKSALEHETIGKIDSLIDTHKIDISEYDSPTNPEELKNLHETLSSKYFTTSETPQESQADTKENPPSDPVDEKFTPEESPAPEEDPVSNEPNTPIDYNLSDFKPISEVNPFSESFKKEDMFKLETFGAVPEDEEIELTDEPPNAEDSVPDAWEVAKKDRSKRDTTQIETTDKEPTKEDKEKVALSEKTSKKATLSLARQGAKLFEFVSELAVKKYSKISDKKIQNMEDKDLIDRNFIVPATNKTIAELVDEHNELIDELVKVDPETREDLIEALMLVAEKHQIKMSPESNLAMVVITMLLTMGKVGYDQKQIMNKMLKKVSNQYTLSKTAMIEAERRNAQLQQQLDNIQNKTFQPSSETPEQPTPETSIKELKFNMPLRKKKNLSVEKPAPRSNKKIEEASPMLEEITSKVEGDTKPQKK